jgi:hypothetical protein
MFGHTGEDICGLGEAGYLFDLDGRIVVVEGQRANSYADLVRLATQDRFRGKELIEVVLLPAIAGG